MALFSDVRFIPVIVDVCLYFLTDMIPSRRRSYETVSIYASILPPGANLCYETDFDGLFQLFSIVVAAFKYAHPMDGDLIELDQTLLLWLPLFNKHRIEILHIGEAY